MDYQFRITHLKNLKTAILKHETQIKEALYHDLGKSFQESYLTEIGVVLSELSLFIKNLKKWMKPIKTKNSLAVFPAKSFLYPESYGRVLIIGPWNYPFQLIMMPLIGAIAAGNTVVIKPSEYAPFTESILITILTSVFTKNEVIIKTGDHLVSQALLSEKFDYIFFTGSPHVGKIVMEKAALHLTPVTLELGGKSPVIIKDTKNLELAVKRIVFGKLINAGQTCIAPDYVLIEEKNKNQFIKYFEKYVHLFYTQDPLTSNDYPKIINQKHHNRLTLMLKDEHIVFGGTYDEHKIAPTLLIAQPDSPSMKEEIFGPILPIITFSQIEEITNHIKEKPLALYLFTDNKTVENYVIKNISAGGITINDTLMHFSNHHLGFGGIGQSGMGKYHGKHSFDTFTHYKPVLKKSKKLDINAKYLPGDGKKEKLIKKILK